MPSHCNTPCVRPPQSTPLASQGLSPTRRATAQITAQQPGQVGLCGNSIRQTALAPTDTILTRPLPLPSAVQCRRSVMNFGSSTASSRQRISFDNLRIIQPACMDQCAALCQLFILVALGSTVTHTAVQRWRSVMNLGPSISRQRISFDNLHTL